MADLYIGVNIKDAQTLTFRRPGVDNAPLNTAGFLVFSNRGVDDVMIFQDFDSAKKALGGFNQNYYGLYAIKGFFENIGTKGVLFVKRLIGNGATAASATYFKVGGGGNAFTVRAGFRGLVDKGIWGNNIRVSVITDPLNLAVLSADATTGSSAIVVNSIDGFVVHDIIEISDGTNTERKVIISINEQTNTITLDSALSNDYASSSTVSRIRIDIYVYNVDLTTGIPSLVEQFKGLSMNYNHPNYILNVINNKEVGSSYIMIDNLSSTALPGDLPQADPSPPSFTTSTQLTGGNNGTPLTNAQIRDALHRFDLYPVRFVANVESFSDSMRTLGEDYAGEMKDRVYVYNFPDLNMSSGSLLFTSFDDLLGYIKPLRKSIRYYSIYFKDWIYINDPLGTPLNPYKKIPSVGHIIGYMIDQILRKGVHRVPANMLDSIKGIVNISNEVIERSKLTDLVENGINVISKVGSGFFLRSSRTISLSRIERYLNTIMTLIYVKESLKGIMEPYENFPTESLPDIAKQVINIWAKDFYEHSSNGGSEGGFGKGSFDEVFKVIVDESVNPKSQLAEGIVKALVYFVPPSAPAEKILLEVGLIDLL